MKINKPLIFIILSLVIIIGVITIFNIPTLNKMVISVTDTNIPKTNTGIGGICNTYEIKEGTKIILNNNVCTISAVDKRNKEISFTLENPLISGIMDVTEFSLKIGDSHKLYDYDYIYNFELVKKGSVHPHEFEGMISYTDSESQYVFIQSEDIIKPNIVLQSDGTFIFSYSSLSSYMAKGKYTKSDTSLILETDDKKYTYTFAIDGLTLKFDKDNSSPIPEFNQITIPDDAIFVQMK